MQLIRSNGDLLQLHQQDVSESGSRVDHRLIINIGNITDYHILPNNVHCVVIVSCYWYTCVNARTMHS